MGVEKEKVVNCAKCPVSVFCTLADVLASHQLEMYRVVDGEYGEAFDKLWEISKKCPLLSLLSNYAPISMGGKKVEVSG